MTFLPNFRFTRFFVLLILTGIQLTGAKADPSENNLSEHPLEECHPRGGLPHFFKKLEQGKTVTIAYLGGSITAQAGWRVQSLQWFQEQYPEARLEGVPAAIGGTGSKLGVFRMQEDALDCKPDLLFVEFAVNDAGAPPADIVKAMEGIVRKTWRQLPETDICFVYTVTAKESPQLAAGTMKQSTQAMESVADYYGIPSVHLGLAVARMEAGGELVMRTSAPMTRVSGDELNEAASLATDEQGRIIFSKDGVHPYPETGYVLYTQALIRAMEQISAQDSASPHALPRPMAPDNWEDARRFPISQDMISGPYRNLTEEGSELAKGVATRVSPLYQLDPGAVLTFQFKGTKAAIYDLIGPDGSTIEITLDGQTQEAKRFDGYCAYHRLSLVDLGDGLENTTHTVSIRVSEQPFDKAAILHARPREDMKQNPEKYAPMRWYPGAILVVGELVE